MASHPDFDDMETAEMIRANMEALRDKLRMYHSSMSREQADMIFEGGLPGVLNWFEQPLKWRSDGLPHPPLPGTSVYFRTAA